MDHARADILAARDKLATRGWIARKSEDFRHLPPPATEVWLGEAAEPAGACELQPLAGAGWTLHPVGDSPQGRVDARWLDALDPLQRAELFAGLAHPRVDDAAPFVWAHRALCRRGLRLRIGGSAGAGRGPDRTVWLQLRHQPRAAVEAPLLVIEVLDGVHCVLVESHDREPSPCHCPLVQNLQTDIRLGDGAALQHLRIVTPTPDDRIAHRLHARLGRGARYDQALIATGSSYHLQRSEIDLHAERSSARCASVLLASASALDQQLRVTHGAARTHSSINALALASGRAHAVANAHTHIAPGADAADVHQRLTGIPIAGQPRVVLRPHLEIHHDNVQAAHGATWGALPEDALFYARQRGLDDRHARALIVEGMAMATLARAVDTPDLLHTLSAGVPLKRALEVLDHE